MPKKFKSTEEKRAYWRVTNNRYYAAKKARIAKAEKEIKESYKSRVIGQPLILSTRTLQTLTAGQIARIIERGDKIELATSLRRVAS